MSTTVDSAYDLDRDVLEGIAEAEQRLASLERCPSIYEVLQEPVNDKWLIGPDLLPLGGLALIAADAGVGKSTLVAQLCASFAAGRGCLGFEVDRPLNVLFLEAEGSRQKFAKRIGVAMAHLGIEAQGLPLYLHPPTFDMNLKSEAFLPAIRRAAADLVVLDTVGMFHGSDENSATEFREQVMKPLQRFTLDTGAGFWMIHHQSKPNELRTGRHSIRGTSAFLGASDLVLRLEKPKDAADKSLRVLHFDKIKYGNDDRPPLALRFLRDKAVFEPTELPDLEAEAKDKKMSSLRTKQKEVDEAVLKFVKGYQGYCGSAEIELHLAEKWQAKTVREARGRLQDAGTLFYEVDPEDPRRKAWYAAKG